jgi:hypothetical protein
MAVMLTKFQRRDNADRVALGTAAFQLCKAQRAVPGVTASRFFWTSADDIAILAEAESALAFDEPMKPELAAAVFALADLAGQTVSERWTDPRDGMSVHQTAGR